MNGLDGTALEGPGADSRIRVVLADDHPVVVEGIAALLEREPDLQILERCTSGSAVIDAISRHRPDVVLLDVRMPPPSGLDVLRAVSSCGFETRFILLTASVDDEDVLEAIRLGVHGLVPKDSLAETLIECVRQVSTGGTCLDPAIVGRAMAALQSRVSVLRDLARVLTPRELEVVEMVLAGLRNREIASRLFVAEGTIKVHLHNIYGKLNISRREELAEYGREKGLDR